FVAGRSGQLARCLADVARERRLPLVSLGRPEFDIENATSIASTVAALSPRAIINAAAYTEVDKAESEAQRAFAINRDGAARLAAAAAKARMPFLHVSTDYVFDGRKSLPYVESDTTLPISVYGRSKLEGEVAIRDVCPEAMILRTSWVYSPYAKNFLKTMLR